MTDDFAKVLDTMTAAATEPEDYAGEDGLLYCSKCRTPKEADRKSTRLNSSHIL